MIHLQKFIDRLQGAESRGLKDFSMPMADAKAIHSDLTRLLLDMQKMRDLLTAQAGDQDQTITVEMTGGKF